MTKDKLFFIAILPSQEIMAGVNAFKENMRDNYGTGKALRVMPHITLKAPFKLPAKELNTVINWFRSIDPGVPPFIVSLSNFGSFDKANKVIFVKPVITDSMTILQNNIVESFGRTFPDINLSTHEGNFKPHITIAYRDLTPDNYEKAWAVYKDKVYTAEFLCESYCLLSHNGSHWDVIQVNDLQP